MPEISYINQTLSIKVKFRRHTNYLVLCRRRIVVRIMTRGILILMVESFAKRTATLLLPMQWNEYSSELSKVTSAELEIIFTNL